MEYWGANGWLQMIADVAWFAVLVTCCDESNTKVSAATPGNVVATEDAHARAVFVLRYIQPGLAGLMDGSVSTLAPVFATAEA